MGSIRITATELAKNFRIWLTIIGQRRPSLIRDLWTRRGEDYDKDKIEFARRELARELADRLTRTTWQVVRPETSLDIIIREAAEGAEPSRGES